MGGPVVPPIYLTRGQTTGEVKKIMVISFRRSHDALLRSVPPTLQQATTDPRLHQRLLNTHSKSGSVSCGVTAPFSWVLAGDSQTQLCLSLCGVSGSWCTQGMVEPCERLWQVWGLILNVISPLLPSCWGFSFTLRCEVSPQSHSSTRQLPL